MTSSGVRGSWKFLLRYAAIHADVPACLVEAAFERYTQQTSCENRAVESVPFPTLLS